MSMYNIVTPTLICADSPSISHRYMQSNYHKE
jgi:hypothetical protein